VKQFQQQFDHLHNADSPACPLQPALLVNEVRPVNRNVCAQTQSASSQRMAAACLNSPYRALRMAQAIFLCLKADMCLRPRPECGKCAPGERQGLFCDHDLMRLAAENTSDCLAGTPPLLDDRNFSEDDVPLNRNLTLPADCRGATLLTRAIAASLRRRNRPVLRSSPRACVRLQGRH
jgi:hypothetical protein